MTEAVHPPVAHLPAREQLLDAGPKRKRLAGRGGPVLAYISYYDYTTPQGWDGTRVIRFYEQSLRSSGWTLVMSWSNECTFLKEPARLHIMATDRGVLLSVNHDRHADGER